MKETIVVTGGGTGGHLKVADAFIEEFYKRDLDVIFIGSKNGQDKKWFENDKRLKKTYFLDTRGVVNKGFLGKIASVFNIISKSLYCFRLYFKYNVKKVISVGGFSAAPATFSSILKPNCNLYIHEQNSRMGKLNEVTAKFAKNLFSSFDENSLIKDYPVASEFFDNARVRHEVKTVIFLGGSQGAVAINDFALKVAKKLDEKEIKIIHQTGAKDFDRVKKEYEKLGVQADVFDFSKELVFKMAQADFAVSRAGASTLWELCANSLPTLFIPYKYAASDHQYFNAEALKDKGLCFLQREDYLTQKEFFEALNSDIHQMSKGLVSSIRPNATSLMVNMILK